MQRLEEEGVALNLMKKVQGNQQSNRKRREESNETVCESLGTRGESAVFEGDGQRRDNRKWEAET